MEKFSLPEFVSLQIISWQISNALIYILASVP